MLKVSRTTGQRLERVPSSEGTLQIVYKFYKGSEAREVCTVGRLGEKVKRRRETKAYRRAAQQIEQEEKRKKQDEERYRRAAQKIEQEEERKKRDEERKKKKSWSNLSVVDSSPAPSGPSLPCVPCCYNSYSCTTLWTGCNFGQSPWTGGEFYPRYGFEPLLNAVWLPQSLPYGETASFPTTPPPGLSACAEDVATGRPPPPLPPPPPPPEDVAIGRPGNGICSEQPGAIELAGRTKETPTVEGKHATEPQLQRDPDELVNCSVCMTIPKGWMCEPCGV